MLPRFAPDPGVRSGRSAEVLPFAAVAVGVGTLADALRPSCELLRGSPPACLRADVGFIGWLGTRRYRESYLGGR
jgi:hypothetical protein